MSLGGAVTFIALLDLALIAGLVLLMSSPRKLTRHHLAERLAEEEQEILVRLASVRSRLAVALNKP